MTSPPKPRRPSQESPFWDTYIADYEIGHPAGQSAFHELVSCNAYLLVGNIQKSLEKVHMQVEAYPLIRG